jgi:hypothetical protein
MVTLLWQAEFASFQYSYVDALAEGLQLPQAQGVPRLAGVELTLVPGRHGTTGAARTEQPAAPQAGQPTVAGLINRDDFEATLYFLEPSELSHLAAEVEREMRRDVKPRC